MLGAMLPQVEQLPTVFPKLKFGEDARDGLVPIIFDLLRVAERVAQAEHRLQRSCGSLPINLFLRLRKIPVRLQRRTAFLVVGRSICRAPGFPDSLCCPGVVNAFREVFHQLVARSGLSSRGCAVVWSISSWGAAD